MGEFQAVMHDWIRMCKHFWSGDPNDDCSENCPLVHVWCPMVDKPMMNVDDVDAARLEAVVTKWAAENPEPIYPTWGEWLLKQGVINAGTETRYGFTYQTVNAKFFEPMDAEIAEKLGVEPVEVKHGR